MESAESWKLEAGSLADRVWICFEPQASCLKRISTLADGLMLVLNTRLAGARWLLTFADA
jgi:hypothetical protein